MEGKEACEKRLPSREHGVCSFPGCPWGGRWTTLSSSALGLPSPVVAPPGPELEDAGPGRELAGEAERVLLVCNLPRLETSPPILARILFRPNHFVFYFSLLVQCGSFQPSWRSFNLSLLIPL